MLIKSLLLGTALVSTPLCLLDHQDPGSTQPQSVPSASPQEPSSTSAPRARAAREADRDDLQRTREELKKARQRLKLLRRQLDSALDRLDTLHEPPPERNCSPSRSRALMTHYRWLRDEGHDRRARVALDKLVDRVGDSVKRLDSTARDLMTDEDTAGRFDEFALALAERMEKKGGRLRHRYLDTIALARFLNGQVDRAVTLQQRAIERGGKSDDYRRRLRTYQAAQAAIARVGGEADPGALVATGAADAGGNEE